MKMARIVRLLVFSLFVLLLLLLSLPIGICAPGTGREQIDQSITEEGEAPEVSVESPFLESPSTWQENLTAMDVKRRYTYDLLKIPGVHGIGLGLKDGRTALHVAITPEEDASLIPEKIEHLDVVVLRLPQAVILDSCGPGGGCNHRAYFPYPVPQGVSTSNNKGNTGTIGFKVCDIRDRNKVGYLTNNHVAASWQWGG